MNYLYNFAIFLMALVLKFLALFDRKISLFVQGRKETFEKLALAIKPGDKTIWVHCASLGEFEQGRPIIERLKASQQDYKIVVSFFSPSGYEVRKDFSEADLVIYLPIDSKSNAKRFIQAVHPSIAIFVKYEFWPNILNELKRNSIHTILISGIFRDDQVFFKSYGGWMKKSLRSFSHFFVQNSSSKSLLNGIGIDRVTISGDTRFDRVMEILEQDNELDFLNDFTKGRIVLVAGSTWPVDETYLLDLINKNTDSEICFIIAPHNIDPKAIQGLKNKLHPATSLYSEGKTGAEFKVFIADTIGILTKIYSYANIAYVGGGFGKDGVHNVLEPAVFGVPLVIGPIYDKFEEAIDLVDLQGCQVANSKEALSDLINRLIEDKSLRKSQGEIAKNYIEEKKGASTIILNYIEDQLADIS